MAKCSMENCTREARRGGRYCQPCHAAKQASYRDLAERKRDRANFHRGFEEGIKACLNYLRTRIPAAAYTGRQVAVLLERNVSPMQLVSGDVEQRRRLLDSINATPAE
jgi:hypothetical protein